MIEIQTIDPKSASAVLSRWEQEDFYYSGIKKSIAGELNMKARGNPYLQTPEAIAKTDQVDFQFPLNGPINLVYLNHSSDSGLPHTRGKTGIAMPVFLLWEPNDKTMQHELVHLSQKQFREKWWTFYEKAWQFRNATEKELLSIPLKWRSRRRINPDTLGSPYMVWKDRYITLSIFTNQTKPDLRYCKRGFWDLKMTQWTWEEPPGWKEMFGSGFNDEHPNEIAAHWIDGSAGSEKKQYIHAEFS
uniref:Uncharacterized protein n=1 Tax=viral metagenome TaxID=1070528 RepID=A0A6C0ANY5_9ZZZZ